MLDPLHEPTSCEGLPLSWGGELNGLALCAGFGGLERGIESLIPSSRTVCYVEGETYPASVLASKMETGSLPKAPIWSNVRTFDGKAWCGKVSFISGGFPCQPYSKAGKQLAEKDARDLWPDFARIIGEVRPHLIFLENVPGVVKWALPTVLEDLSKMGYDAAWCVVAASEVGAPHMRKRWFLLAYAQDSSEHVMRINESLKGPQEFERIDVAHSKSSTSKEPQRTRRKLRPEGSRLEKRKDKRKTWDKSGGCCKKEEFRNANGDGLEKHADKKNLKGFIEGWEMEGDRPKDISPVITNSNSERTERHRNKSQSGQILQRHINDESIKPRRLEDWWKVEPPMGRMVDGVAHWVHRIRGCGNGVVPQQAAYAYRILMERLLCN